MEIAQLIKYDSILPPRITRYLQGAAGLGKSSVVKLIAKQRGYNVVDLRLSELEPADLVGMPQVICRADGRHETIYAAPSWWFKLEENDGKTVLFLDELDRASENMQPLAMQLTLDRRAGGRDLPKNVIIYAAGNGEKYQTAHLDQALVNRMVLIDFTPTVTEWLAWADQTAESLVHPAVPAFIRANKGLLDIPEGKIGEMNKAVTSRRSWSALGEALHLNEDCNKDLAAVARDNDLFIWGSGFIGDVVAQQFANWVKENYSPLDLDKVMAGKMKGKASKFPITQVTQSLDDVFHRFTNDSSLTPDQKANAGEFYLELGLEIFGQFFNRLNSSDSGIIRMRPALTAAVKDMSQAKLKFKQAGKKAPDAAT